MDDSILTSIKKALGITEDYEVFDFELLMHINSALANLVQFKVGPPSGLMIEDKDAVWSDLVGTNKKLNNVKTYIFLKTKLLFDPPGTPHLLTAFEERIREEEFRLMVESDQPTLPESVLVMVEDLLDQDPDTGVIPIP